MIARAGQRQRAFTLVELCIGMMVMGFVAVVLATFASAMSHQWRYSEGQQHLDVTARQGLRLLRPVVQSSRAIGHIYTTPTAAVFLWQNDKLDRPNIAQFGEMALIEYDDLSKTIYLYEPDPEFDLELNAMAVEAVTNADMANPTVVELFKAQPWLKPRRAILGPGESAAALSRVTSCTFSQPQDSGTGGVLPMVALDATLERNGQTLRIRDRIAVRLPMLQTHTNVNTVTGN